MVKPTTYIWGKKRQLRLEHAYGYCRQKTAVPLGKNGDEMVPAACVGSPDCGVEQEEQQKVNRSHSTGCQIGCQLHYSPSGLTCQPVCVI